MGRHAQKATPASAVSALFSQVGTGNVVYRAGRLKWLCPGLSPVVHSLLYR